MKPRFPAQSGPTLGAGPNYSQTLAPVAYNREHVIESEAITPLGNQLGKNLGPLRR
jgi:hypothetical protein